MRQRKPTFAKSGRSAAIPLRVCIFIPDLADGGAQRQCTYLVNSLSERPNVEVTFVRYRTGVHDKLLDKDGVNAVFLGLASNYDPRAILRVRKIIRRNQCDILMSWLHASDIWSFFACVGDRRVSWLLTERNSRHPDTFRFKVRRFLGRFSGSIVSNSEGGDLYWRHATPRFGRHVIQNIVPGSFGLSREGGEGVARYAVLVVGRLERQKDPLRCVRVSAELVRRDQSASVAFVGDGSMRGDAELLAGSLVSDDSIKFLGFRQDVAEVMASGRVLLTLSHHEGQPNVLIEAVCLGLAVVASDIREHRVLLGADYPFVVHSGDSDAVVTEIIERALKEFVADVHLGYARSVLTTMSSKAVSDQYLALMESVVKRRSLMPLPF